MRLLEYRLKDGELHDRAQRRALFSDMIDAHPDWRRFLTDVEALLNEGDEEAQTTIRKMEDELRDVYADLEAAQASISELRDDVDYWKERAHDKAD